MDAPRTPPPAAAARWADWTPKEGEATPRPRTWLDRAAQANESGKRLRLKRQPSKELIAGNEKFLEHFDTPRRL